MPKPKPPPIYQRRTLIITIDAYGDDEQMQRTLDDTVHLLLDLCISLDESDWRNVDCDLCKTPLSSPLVHALADREE